jgi:two-component system chemotaxis response regulator CheB
MSSVDRVVRVLVVDDSAYVRKTIKSILSRGPFIEVVGVAHDAREALEQIEKLRPDVVTLDLIMPGMDGVAFLREQMARLPVPVVVVSVASESGEMAFEALDAGAIDFVQKPTALASDTLLTMGSELIEKVKAAATIPASRLVAPPAEPGPVEPVVAAPRVQPRRVDLVVIGISTGGPQALKQLIPQLPSDLPVPVAIVLHMPVGYTQLYARQLDAMTALTVVEASDAAPVRAGTVLLAQAGRHLKLRRGPGETLVTHLDARPFDTSHRPSVDVLFRSAAELCEERVLGVVMTGMGHDGREGAAWIKARGGLVYTEAEESCVVYGMPRSVVEAGLSDRAIPLGKMARAILEVV